MIALDLPAGALSVLGIAAHPDDLEIGAGGTLLELAQRADLSISIMLFSGTPERVLEAQAAAAQFAPGADLRVTGFSDGRLPGSWNDVKEEMESTARHFTPDVIFSPTRLDAHQDHQLVSSLVPTVWRDSLVLEYEIPKWDGDLDRVTHYVAVTPKNARRKVELLDACYPSQVVRDWWDAELFLGLMRLRGVECRTRYAEGFIVRKALLQVR